MIDLSEFLHRDELSAIFNWNTRCIDICEIFEHCKQTNDVKDFMIKFENCKGPQTISLWSLEPHFFVTWSPLPQNVWSPSQPLFEMSRNAPPEKKETIERGAPRMLSTEPWCPKPHWDPNLITFKNFLVTFVYNFTASF